jgi:uncharacterized protein (DUF58 family)
MRPSDLLRQVRRLHLRARRAVEDILGGEYHSVFKGLGLAFEEVREYQPGDDIRTIDWNVTARMGHPFVKRFVEERELTALLLVDGSASLEFGSGRQTKREVATELAALLALSAIRNNDKVGLLLFTDRVERFIPPRKGTRHVLRLLRELVGYQPCSPGTSLRQALETANRLLRRRAIVFLLSDFLDRDYEKSVQRTARRHDLVALWVRDPLEEELPAVGLLAVADAETGQQQLWDTSRAEVRAAYAQAADQQRAALRQLLGAARGDLIEVSTQGDHVQALVRFFQRRQRRWRRS